MGWRVQFTQRDLPRPSTTSAVLETLPDLDERQVIDGETFLLDPCERNDVELNRLFAGLLALQARDTDLRRWPGDLPHALAERDREDGSGRMIYVPASRAAKLLGLRRDPASRGSRAGPGAWDLPDAGALVEEWARRHGVAWTVLVRFVLPHFTDAQRQRAEATKPTSLHLVSSGSARRPPGAAVTSAASFPREIPADAPVLANRPLRDDAVMLSRFVDMT